MNKIERVSAVIEGRLPDRPPVSFWHHFGEENVAGLRAVAAHIRHAETYDLDFLKVMNDARYPLEGGPEVIIREPADLNRFTVLRGDEGVLGQQLELLTALARRFGGERLMATTIFNSWSTLRRLTASDSDVHGPPTLERVVDVRDATMSRLLLEAPRALAAALTMISESLSNFARRCLEAGANGIYLSVRDDWVDTAENGPGVYDRLVKSGDLQILEAAREGTFNMLHVCGKALDFARFAEYPVQVINWADRTAGPRIAEVAGRIRPAICCGVDNLRTLLHGSPADCEAEVRDAIAESSGRPLMIAPGCTFDSHAVPSANLHALRRAVEGGW